MAGIRKNKFNAKRTKFNGLYYDSVKESVYAQNLEWLRKAKEIKSWSAQHRWELYVNRMKIRQYTIDFRVVNLDGTIDYIEVKGMQTYSFQITWKLTQALFDELTEGENARLYLNEKLVLQSFKEKIKT